MAYDPFWIFQSPLSGDVNQRINAPWFSPALTVNIAGNAEIEERVVSEVASYGKQLGWLNEIVLALANGQKPSAKTLSRMKDAVKAIEAIKEGKELSSLQAAIEALDRLKNDQPEQYQELLRARLR
jgi:hypothetical protein